jgi:hypothetical protein
VEFAEIFDTRRPPALELVEFVELVDVNVETEDEVEFVDVIVNVEVTWTVVVATLPLPEPLCEPPAGGGNSGAAPRAAGVLPPTACNATRTDPVPARMTRTSMEATDNF